MRESHITNPGFRLVTLCHQPLRVHNLTGKHSNMKTKLSHRWLSLVLAGVGLAGSSTYAAPDFFFNTFSNATAEAELAGYFKGWGAAPLNVTVDTSRNGPMGPAASSGAMKLEAAFDFAAYGGDNQFAWLHALNGKSWGFWDGNATLPTSDYDQFEYDIYFDPSCPTESGGNIASFEDFLIDYQDTAASLDISHDYTAADTGKWIHVVRQIPGSFPSKISGVGFKIWSGNPGGLTGTTKFWIDNVKLRARVGPIVLPTIGNVEKVAVPGLWLGVPGPSGGGTRQGIYTPNATYPWSGVATPATPVTYSMTIADYPAERSGLQAHMFLVGDAAQNTSAIDWNGNHVVFLRIMNRADGTAYANMWFKTNAPYAYSNMIYNASHQLVTDLNSATAAGKWSITFTNNTEGKVIAPDGSSKDFAMPPDAVSYFASPYVSVGIQGNNDNYAGKGITLSKVEIVHPYGDVSDTFTAPPLDNTKWAVAAGSPSGVQIVQDGLWLNWSLPASGYDLLASANISAPLSSWTTGLITNNPSFAPIIFANAGRTVVPRASLPGSEQNYFMLRHEPAFTKLQVLMPGETSAPMTPLGKTGTPTAQKVGVPFTITVNACDDYWQLVSATDSVAISSSDTAATLPSGDALVNGTKTFSVTLGTTGSATITVTDVTDPAKEAQIGTDTQVNP